MSIESRLITVLNNYSIPLAKVARRADIPADHVYQIKNGQRRITVDYYFRLCKAMQINPIVFAKEENDV